ncbi:MAG: hypothetical protein GX580_13270, partial [Candidatus Hydrogenedens sp.]|nr:hypothetical protein [Candidatus Hydrogenedens sp.]
GSYWTMGLFLLGVGIVFMGALRHAVGLAWGEPVMEPEKERAGGADRVLVVVALGALLLLGLWIPGLLWRMIEDAVRIVEGAS